MRRRLIRSRTVALLAVACLALVAWAAVAYGPVAAFHLLPPALTGEEGRLAELLEAEPGKVIAEIGAGDGQFSVAIARRLQPGGILYSTEIDRKLLREIEKRAEREKLSNVQVVEAGAASTNLPDECCDAAFMRNVYHHIEDTRSFNRSLRKSVRPGGRVVVIDFPSGSSGGGHGVNARVVVKEMESAGFIAERIDDDWGGRTYMVLLRAPGGETEGARSRRGPAVFALRLQVARLQTHP